jgi:glycerol-3-phosphate acyltransferase PlsY
MSLFFHFVIIAVLAYLLGSIPWGLIISKKFFGFDIRTKGSGNMGSTNVIRVLGWKWGIAVQILDILKGVAAVYLASVIGAGLTFPNVTNFQDITIIKFGAGFVAVLGHIFTIFAGFRGGKGINTALGMLIAIAPIELAIAIGVFMLVVFLSGYVSLGSIIAGIAVPSALFVRYNFYGIQIPGYHFLIYAFILLSLVVIYTHRSNIKRLIEGRENQFAKLQLIKIKLFQPKNKV